MTFNIRDLLKIATAGEDKNKTALADSATKRRAGQAACHARWPGPFQSVTFSDPRFSRDIYWKAVEMQPANWHVFSVVVEHNISGGTLSQGYQRMDLDFFAALDLIAQFENSALDQDFILKDAKERDALGFSHYKAFGNREGIIFDAAGDPHITRLGEIVTVGDFPKAEMDALRERYTAHLPALFLKTSGGEVFGVFKSRSIKEILTYRDQILAIVEPVLGTKFWWDQKPENFKYFIENYRRYLYIREALERAQTACGNCFALENTAFSHLNRKIAQIQAVLSFYWLHGLTDAMVNGAPYTGNENLIKEVTTHAHQAAQRGMGNVTPDVIERYVADRIATRTPVKTEEIDKFFDECEYIKNLVIDGSRDLAQGNITPAAALSRPPGPAP